ncbi:glycoside hydrolase family 15 protein [Actinomadura craniellae]|uniref:glycoside hydrolase family 15 n=1 Tax=Actinomadura craniellae TaxID=2231787 RepID=UPI0011BECEC1|nr:glycoside hydrolase family 15 [Actinomadura craniellae]
MTRRTIASVILVALVAVLGAGAPRGAAAPDDERAWLAAGRIPGAGTPHRAMAERALLDLRLLTRPDGAALASWRKEWRYVWPRDAAFAAVAFQAAEHPREAGLILDFLARVQPADGRWAARYREDGSPVEDGRPPQGDAPGWPLWAAWLQHRAGPPDADRWRMVQRAADRLAGSLDRAGLPPPSSDYWERKPRTEQEPDLPTLGVAAPALLGLRSAAALARETGRPVPARRWQAAACRLAAAIDRRFAPHGYPRSPVPGGRMDTSVTFLAPPYAPRDERVTAAVERAARRLALPNGGVLPGERWAGDRKTAWTPEMGLFALAAAAGGQPAVAGARLDWLSAHRTPQGSLPEKVDARGRPRSVAPLGWTAALVVLTLAEAERPLPVPSARCAR